MILAFVLATLAATQQSPTQQPLSPQQGTPPIQPNLTPVPLPPAVVIPGPASPQEGGDRPLTADEAARIALRLQPSIRLAEAAILAAQGAVQIAASGLRPTVGLTSTYTRIENLNGGSATGGTGGATNSGGGSSSGFNNSVALRQLIFDFNHTRDVVRQSQALERAQRHNLTRAQNDLVLDVKNAFYTFAQNNSLVAIQEANLANTQAQLRLAQARLDAGLGAPADVVTAQTNVAAAAQSLAQARATALTSRIALATLMGIDARTPITTGPSVEPAPDGDDLGRFVDVAIQNRPEIRQYRETLRAAGYELSAAKTTSAPSIVASVGLGSRGPDDPFASQTATFGLTLNWNFIDAGLTAGRTQQARADIQTAQANLQSASQGVVRDVSQAYVTLRTSEQRADIARSQVANAQEALRLAQGRFAAGLATFLEVTNAQAQLVSAQASSVAADTAVQQARAALRRAMGMI